MTILKLTLSTAIYHRRNRLTLNIYDTFMKRIPPPVTKLICIVLFSMLYNSIRIYSILINSETLTIYQSHPGPLFLVISSAFWLAIGILLIIGIIKRLMYMPIFIYLSSVLGVVWYWVDRLIFQKRITAFLFPTIESVFILFIIYLFTSNHVTKNYFREQAIHD